MELEDKKPYVYVEKHDRDGESMKYYFNIVTQDTSSDKRALVHITNNEFRTINGQPTPDTFEILLGFGEVNTAAATNGFSHLQVVIPENTLPTDRRYTIVTVQSPGKPDGDRSVIVKNNDEDDD